MPAPVKNVMAATEPPSLIDAFGILGFGSEIKSYKYDFASLTLLKFPACKPE